MEHRRPSLIGPLILITLGVLFLLVNLGYLPLSLWEIAFRFWPLILILVGVEILIGRRSFIGGLVVTTLWLALVAGVVWIVLTTGLTGATITETINQPIGEIARATIDLDIGFANVIVKALGEDTNDLMRGTFRHAEGIQIGKVFNTSGNEGRLTLREERVNFFTAGMTESRWEIALNPTMPITLRLNGGVGHADLDLSALTISTLDVDAGIGNARIIAPQRGNVLMRLDGGVGNLHVTIPEGVAARIQVDRGIGTVRVNEARFPKMGNVYQSANWERAESQITIQIAGGIGTIEVR
ncbi:MAG: DUF5668 domain-containing protein [Anaerolineae bacterium]|nr:DUF5668 domain-containing protein [Anaerolineae bacterium]